MMKFWVIASLALAASFICSHAEQCGDQAGGAECPSGLCCSQWGWCGTTEEYCGVGCQSNCWKLTWATAVKDDIINQVPLRSNQTRSNEQCGRQAGDAECPGGLCCSAWGWCGTTADYCTGGCQSNCWKLTWATAVKDGIINQVPLRSNQTRSNEQCGAQAGDAECPGGLCCSQWGWCGTTADYCAGGCQSNCWKAARATAVKDGNNKKSFRSNLLLLNE